MIKYEVLKEKPFIHWRLTSLRSIVKTVKTLAAVMEQQQTPPPAPGLVPSLKPRAKIRTESQS